MNCNENKTEVNHIPTEESKINNLFRFSNPKMKGHSIELDLFDACQCEWCREQRKASQKSRIEKRRPKFPEQTKIPKYLQPKKKRFYAMAIFVLFSIIASIALIPTATANLYYPDFRNGSITNTVKNLDLWIYKNIKYEFHDLPQLPEETLYTKKGDCTDFALLSVSILQGYHIQTRLVWGYAESFNSSNSGYHAWFEFRNESNQWDTLEKLYFKNLTIYEYNKVR